MAHQFLHSEAENDAVRVDARQVRLPQWVVLFLFGLLVNAMGGIWWAATVSTKLDNEIARRVQAEQVTETYRLQVEALRKDVAYLTGLTAGKGRGSKEE